MNYISQHFPALVLYAIDTCVKDFNCNTLIILFHCVYLHLFNSFNFPMKLIIYLTFLKSVRF